MGQALLQIHAAFAEMDRNVMRRLEKLEMRRAVSAAAIWRKDVASAA